MTEEQAPAPAQRTAKVSRSSTLARLRRDDQGLTTLEWLLIVAAVAGLAALAVVLVTNVVSQTAEQIEGQSARLTAARLAADQIEQDLIADAAAAAEADLDNQSKGTAFARDALRACRRLAITYTDLRDVNTVWDWDGAGTAGLGNAPIQQSDWTAAGFLDDSDEGCVITANVG